MKIEPDLRLVLNNYLGLVDSAWKPVHNPASPIRYLPLKRIVLLLSEKTKKKSLLASLQNENLLPVMNIKDRLQEHRF